MKVCSKTGSGIFLKAKENFLSLCGKILRRKQHAWKAVIENTSVASTFHSWSPCDATTADTRPFSHRHTSLWTTKRWVHKLTQNCHNTCISGFRKDSIKTYAIFWESNPSQVPHDSAWIQQVHWKRKRAELSKIYNNAILL